MLLLLALTGMIAAIFGAIILAYRPIVGVYAIGVLTLLSWDFPVLPGIAVGGLMVYPEDFLAVVALTVTLPRWPKLYVLPAAVKYAGGLLAVLVLWSLASGFSQFGTSAITEGRGIFHWLAFTIWALSLPWQKSTFRHSFTRWACLTAVGLVAVASFHIYQYGLGATDDFVVSSLSGAVQTGRPLNGMQTVVLAFLAFYLLTLRRSNRPPATWAVVVVSLLTVLLAQHRSVWVAALVGVLILMLASRGRSRIAIWVGVVVATLASSLFLAAGLFSNVAASLTDAMDDTRTLNNRQEGWDFLLAQAIEGDATTVLLGEPFGSGWERFENGFSVDYAPHNWYLLVFLRTGLVGFCALAIVLLAVAVSLMKARNPGALAGFAIMLVFSWVYSMPALAAPLLALTISAATARRPRVPNPNVEAPSEVRRSTSPILTVSTRQTS